eukprot:CAMPEP_0180515146 /NCGR_PEP_ID=MMETSP1036_2-20121128/53152_1 /TAXON_ID=632150 /ORGANISM="Azadinium spinosum, Strain 3D9" /LENGTH=131 /DNA_ID=CAMNT_0022526705 /DNA_START=177 /DNA_END=573 /DNA_ORIENTATION=-
MTPPTTIEHVAPVHVSQPREAVVSGLQDQKRVLSITLYLPDEEHLQQLYRDDARQAWRRKVSVPGEDLGFLDTDDNVRRALDALHHLQHLLVQSMRCSHGLPQLRPWRRMQGHKARQQCSGALPRQTAVGA